MKVFTALASLALLLSLQGEGIANAKPMDKIIDETAGFLIRDWITDPRFKDYYPPQVISVQGGTKVYGGCGAFIHGDEVAGSAYCPVTNTIYLEPTQLTFFYENFGASSVAYVLAHEFGHAIQARYDDLDGGVEVELQADCLAGVLIDIGSEQLGITRQETLQMAQTAYAIGDSSHGTGAQRLMHCSPAWESLKPAVLRRR